MNALQDWYERLKARMYLNSGPPALRRVIRAWKEFEHNLSHCDSLTEREQALFQERIIDIADHLDIIEQKAFICVHVPKKSAKHFRGLLLGRAQGLPDKPRDPGLVPFYVHTSTIALEEIWKEIQWNNFKRDYAPIYHIWFAPTALLATALMIVIGFWVVLMGSILILSTHNWNSIRDQVGVVLTYWKTYLLLSSAPIISAVIVGHICRRLWYPYIGWKMATIERKAQTNTYYRRQLSGLHLLNTTPFYAFMGKFVQGYYELEDPVAQR